MTDLDRLVREHYQEQTLADRSVERILAFGADHRRWQRQWYMRLAAAVALVVLGLGLLDGYLDGRSLTERVVGEIAMNHDKALAVEVTAVDFGSLAPAMAELDFSLRPPRRELPTLGLIGGRYCSIQGEIAAQVKLRDGATGAVATLYVTRLTDDLAALDATSLRHQGIDIDLWIEDDMFFGLARDAAESSADRGGPENP